MGVVVFDPAGFVSLYPAFAAYNTANPSGLQGFFNMATLFLNNKDSSIVCDVVERQQYLYLLTAHIAQLEGANSPGGVGSTAGQVGRVSSATEGSVTAQMAMQGTANSAWYQQTQYGAIYWQATAKFRSLRYARPPFSRRCC